MGNPVALSGPTNDEKVCNTHSYIHTQRCYRGQSIKMNLYDRNVQPCVKERDCDSLDCVCVMDCVSGFGKGAV